MFVMHAFCNCDKSYREILTIHSLKLFLKGNTFVFTKVHHLADEK